MSRIDVDPRRGATLLITLLLPAAVTACGSDAAQEESEATMSTVASGPFAIEDVGFQTPESVLYDEAADVYLVTNINGNPTDRDDNGFISRVSPMGEVLELRWIDGEAEEVTLNAPKGMALKGDTLFVADIDAVRAFHRESGEPLGSRAIEGATFVNDLTIGADGTLYASDSAGDEGTAAVYRFDADGVTTVASGSELNRPNGIVATGDGLVVVTFGSNEVYRLNASGNRTPVATLPTGALDGVVRLDGGTLLVSSWDGQAIYRVDTTGSVETVAENVEAPADIGYDTRRGRVLIPLFMQDRVEVVDAS